MARSNPGAPGGIAPMRLVAGIGAIVVVDAFTKLLAVDRLVPTHVPHPVLGDFVRLTLVYNPGAAWGLHFGERSRIVFIALTFIALGVLWSMYRASTDTQRARVLAIASVAAGAIGNLIDRLRSARGVVDFVDIGISESLRWPIFNVADVAVTGGALALAVILWREDREKARD